MTFYRCETCGNIVTKLYDKTPGLVCCGQPMKELLPGTTDASREKHVPFLDLEGGLLHIRVGEAAHPMTPEHYIQLICLEQGNNIRIKYLKPGDAPEAVFPIQPGSPLTVYEYCNLHGLWKAELFGMGAYSNDHDDIVACSPEFSQGCVGDL